MKIIHDPLPNVALEKIDSISLRLECLIARSTSSLMQSEFARVVGILPTFGGLDYHAKRYLDRASRMPDRFGLGIKQPMTAHGTEIHHEAIAWLNRLGQLYHFVKSSFVKERVKVPTPTIEALISFRKKHSAHRSIDYPWKDETPNEREMQALTMSGVSGYWLQHRAEVEPAPWRNRHSTNYFVFPMNIGGKWKQLAIEIEHPKVMQEGYEIMTELLR